MEIWFYWAFLDDNKLDHVETITTEITYFNGATFQMATMPIQLRIFAEITETITAETVQFSTMRPANNTQLINQPAINSYTNNEISATLNVSLYEYIEDFIGPPSLWGKDFAKIRIDTNTTINADLIHTVVIRFSRTDALADLAFHPPSLVKASEHEAYIQPVISYPTKNYSSSVGIYWVFLDQNYVNHSLTVNLEITYSDRRTFKKVIVLIILEVLVV